MEYGALIQKILEIKEKRFIVVGEDDKALNKLRLTLTAVIVVALSR